MQHDTKNLQSFVEEPSRSRLACACIIYRDFLYCEVSSFDQTIPSPYYIGVIASFLEVTILYEYSSRASISLYRNYRTFRIIWFSPTSYSPRSVCSVYVTHSTHSLVKSKSICCSNCYLIIAPSRFLNCLTPRIHSCSTTNRHGFARIDQ